MLGSSMGAVAGTPLRRNEKAKSERDLECMRAVIAFTARSLRTRHPRPFGAAIVSTKSGQLLLTALNNVTQSHDPSAHAEVRAIRLAAKKLKQVSLAGYTLYSTCEPCPMCMSTALWAELDRVVYGATIKDASHHFTQIRIPAKEVAARGDMKCVVEGPTLRDQCYALFTHPTMLRAIRELPTRKRR